MIVEDEEFGEVVVRRSPLARGVRFTVSTSGRLTMSVPTKASVFWAKRMLNANRATIRPSIVRPIIVLFITKKKINATN